ncbi:MAG: hypothetical protein KKG60_03160 [Nanoarchaeota archaeon]|nr:hypothetical protein [Nanoarchaeota archaeon]
MKNKIMIFSHFKGGIIKKCFGVGLDAGVLIALITNPIKSKEILLEDLQEQKDLLYTHPIAFQEARRRLYRGFNYSWEESLKVLKNLKKEFNIKEVSLIKNNPKLKELDKLCEKDNCDAGDNDKKIISDFKESGIFLTYSNNNHFIRASKLIGLNSRKFPSDDKILKKKYYDALINKPKQKRGRSRFRKPFLGFLLPFLRI